MPVRAELLSIEAYRRSARVRDLTDPGQGAHALQLLVDEATSALTRAWRAQLIVRRANPIVPIEDNYDRLHYPPDGAARDARYTRYASERLVFRIFRTQTSAMIPPALADLARDPLQPDDVLLACPGLVYRRDAIDRLHTGEPHQLDLWRICRGQALGRDDLLAMIDAVIAAVLPGTSHRVIEAEHPYTVGGLQIDVLEGGEWVEVGECGIALPALLTRRRPRAVRAERAQRPRAGARIGSHPHDSQGHPRYPPAARERSAHRLADARSVAVPARLEPTGDPARSLARRRRDDHRRRARRPRARSAR